MNPKTNLGVSAKCNSAKQGFPLLIDGKIYHVMFKYITELRRLLAELFCLKKLIVFINDLKKSSIMTSQNPFKTGLL
jgi:hypothetical protein